MKQTLFTTPLLLLWLAGCSTGRTPSSLKIPAYTAYTDPDANGARISQNSGVTGWRDPSIKVSWFGDIKAPTSIDAAVELRLPTNATSKLRLTVAGQ